MFQNTKKIFRLNHLLSFIVIVPGYLFLATGCNTRVEGCLDVAAANFDLNADRACSDCCTYPLMSVSLSQKWSDRNFSSNDTLSDVNAHPFKIIDLKYFLSSWTWYDSEHTTFTVDSAEVPCNGLMIRYTPDILLVDSRQFEYTLGTIRLSPLMDSLKMDLGIIPALDCVDATALNIPIALSDKSALWDTRLSSLAAVRIVLQCDLNLETFDTLYIHTFQKLNLKYDFDIKPGLQTSLKISVDYAPWFSQVDVQNPGSFESSFLAGLEGSIYKTP